MLLSYSLLIGFWFLGAALCASIAITATRTVPRLMAIWRAVPVAKIALTIDDGPSAASAELLDALKTHGVPATFFCIGARLEAAPALAKRALGEGHELCNHTFSHSRRFAVRGEIFAREELLRADALLAALGASHASRRYARAVAGIVSPPVGRAAKSLGMRLVHWTATARDGGPVRVSVGRALKRLRPGLVPGGILVIHDRPGQPAAALIGPLVAEAKARGLSFVTLSELLSDRAA
ncbi:MAG: polysaccharide deacetylase family protein [Deltaproteobacteria bacterium]|nr:polysaccharide deacetylase family protein [Deltaproteobacteria bacterium]